MGGAHKPKPAAVHFEDMDTGLGDWGETSYTVNRQTAIAELMALADRPEVTAVGVRSGPRSASGC